VRKTDLVLTLTPQIIRTPDIRDEDLVPLFIGTKNNPHLRGKESSPFGPDPFAPDPELDGLIADEAKVDAMSTGAGAAEGAPAAEPQKPAAERVKAPSPEEAGPATPAQVSPEPVEISTTPEAAPADSVEEEDQGPDSHTFTDPRTGRRMIEETIPPSSGEPTPTPEGQLHSQPPVQQFTLSLSPSKLTVAGGGGFAFNLRVAGASNLQQVGMTITYDPAIADFDRGLEGVLMRGDGTATRFSATKTGPGKVRVDLSRLGSRRGATGNGPIASMRFKPVGPGEMKVMVSDISASDPAGSAIPVEVQGADVTVSQ
jgi:hypothetical protein